LGFFLLFAVGPSFPPKILRQDCLGTTIASSVDL